MNNPEQSDEPEGKDYANAYAHFFTALKTLVEDAKVQCVIKQYDNVGWELKHFTIGLAEAILKIPGGRLSVEQREGVLQLLADLIAVPDDVVNVGNTKEGHRRAMSDSAWLPVRAQAKTLMLLLDSETERIDAILWPSEDNRSKD